nr:transient receptor potential cation channel subfamily A member 1-like [Cherax quadricarinatus]
MFLEILNTLMKVLLVFSVLIVAFSLSFYILMSHGGYLSFSNVAMSMMHTFSMMLGEVDFLNIFVYPFYQESVRGERLLFPLTTFVLLGMFMILMPILLINLLIGLAVGDIESVKKDAQLKRIAMQVELHTELERKMPEVIIQRVNKSEVLVYPNSSGCKTILSSVLSAFNFACPMNNISRSAVEDVECGSSEKYLCEAFNVQRKKLRDISAVLDQQTKLLRMIMQKMEIKSEADECDEGVSLDDCMKEHSISSSKFSASSRRSRCSTNY